MRLRLAQYFFLYRLENNLPYNRLGLTVSRKAARPTAGNRIRRCLREVFRRNKEKLAPGYDLVFNVKRSAVGVPYGSLERDFLRSVRAKGIS